MSEREVVVVELACTQCGAAACEINAPQLTGAERMMLKGALAGYGARPDGGPILGFTTEQVAKLFAVRCVVCVDAGASVGPLGA